MSKLNVLVIHRLGDPKRRREAVRALEFMIPESRPDLNCFVHDSELPFPDYLLEIDYHLIVLGPTFLCNRYNEVSLQEALQKYGFIASSNACKVALPQDDYDCSGILDDWMCDWGVDRIYTVCPMHWDILYPRLSINSEIQLGYTGYVSENWINAWHHPRPHNLRAIDVSYRASKLPPNFGSLGQLKSNIANQFILALGSDSKLQLDISIDPKDLIPGEKWHEFIENSKFCLTTASGSSLLDPRNQIRIKVNQYARKNPNASFHEIEQNCFPGLDGLYTFTAISPRNIEAALAETVQLATAGSYSDLMDPVEHYIPLNGDCSNISEVLTMMDDLDLVHGIKSRCKESILSEPRLRRSVIVDEIVTFAESIASTRHIAAMNQEKVESLLARYRIENAAAERRFWRQWTLKQSAIKIAANLGGRKIKEFLYH